MANQGLEGLEKTEERPMWANLCTYVGLIQNTPYRPQTTSDELFEQDRVDIPEELHSDVGASLT